MIENRFSRVGRKIKNEFIDEIRRQYQRPRTLPLDEDVLRNVPERETSLEEEERAQAFDRLLEAQPDDMPEGQSEILAVAREMLAKGTLDEKSVAKIDKGVIHGSRPR